MGISRQVLTSLSEAAWPRLTQESEEQRRAAIMRKVDRLNAWIVGCWHGAMAVTLHSFLGWLVKPDWLAGPLLIDLLIARNFFVLLASPHSYGLMSVGRFQELAAISWREVLICFVAGNNPQPRSGIEGNGAGLSPGDALHQQLAADARLFSVRARYALVRGMARGGRARIGWRPLRSRALFFGSAGPSRAACSRRAHGDRGRRHQLRSAGRRDHALLEKNGADSLVACRGPRLV